MFRCKSDLSMQHYGRKTIVFSETLGMANFGSYRVLKIESNYFVMMT
jgi:hypothetical protein